MSNFPRLDETGLNTLLNKIATDVTGQLDDLETTEKSSLVGAINENHTALGNKLSTNGNGENVTVNTFTSSSASMPTLSAGDTLKVICGKLVKWMSDVASKLVVMTGASSSAAGTSGFLPPPPAGAQGKFFKGDGTWGNAAITQQAIDGVNFDGSAAISHYATCSTSAGTTAKTASITGFTLATGARVFIKFSYTNTATAPTLNISSTGAKNIKHKNANPIPSLLLANGVYEFVYDGSYWQLVGGTLDGSAYMETSITTSTSSAVSATFSHAAITTNSVIDVYTSKYGLNHSNISVSSGSCTVTFPAQSSAASVTVRIYIR